MLTYTGPWPFSRRGEGDPILPGGTVPESDADYDYLKTRGDFLAAVPAQPSADAPSSAAPKRPKTPKISSGR